MKRFNRNTLLFVAAAAAVATSVQVVAHLDDKQPMQSYRQSYFTLLGMNFGPIADMVKGEMPWNEAMLKTFAGDLGTLARMDVVRAFPPGSNKGTTRAKPEIWENREDFTAKFEDLQQALSALQVAAGSGDREIIAEATAAAGKACKSCHDDYKSKEYLY